jgi:adenylate kinase
MKIVLIGIQGAGKSTQGNKLSQKYKVPYLSSGHIFREIAKEKSKLGRWLKETLNSGALVPDDTTLEIVLTYLERPEYEAGFILDGFPRTVPQAKAFNGNLDNVVYIKVSDKEALWRISGRDDVREDETLHALRKRISLFHEVTEPVVRYYEEEKKLIEVDGEQSVEDVFKSIVKEVKTKS